MNAFYRFRAAFFVFFFVRDPIELQKWFLVVRFVQSVRGDGDLSIIPMTRKNGNIHLLFCYIRLYFSIGVQLKIIVGIRPLRRILVLTLALRPLFNIISRGFVSFIVVVDFLVFELRVWSRTCCYLFCSRRTNTIFGINLSEKKKMSQSEYYFGKRKKNKTREYTFVRPSLFGILTDTVLPGRLLCDDRTFYSARACFRQRRPLPPPPPHRPRLTSHRDFAIRVKFWVRRGGDWGGGGKKISRGYT